MQPKPIALPEMVKLNNVEAIDSVIVDGEAHLLMMSDEGNVRMGRRAKYMLLGYRQLSAE